MVIMSHSDVWMFVSWVRMILAVPHMSIIVENRQYIYI